MPAIRIPKENWGKVWHALLDIGELHRIPPEDEKVYIVSDKYIEHLKAQNLPYEEVSLQTFLANFSFLKKSLIKRNNWNGKV